MQKRKKKARRLAISKFRRSMLEKSGLEEYLLVWRQNRYDGYVWGDCVLVLRKKELEGVAP